jgi:pimeloyl-ACP methyl ester carboxylesterase
MQGRIVGCFLIALVDLSAVLGTVMRPREEKAAASQAPQLPAPQGPYVPGRVAFDWADTSRSSSCYRAAPGGREMMVYLWYPSSSTAPGRGPYIPHARAIDAVPADREVASQVFGQRWDQMVTGEVHAHAVDGAPPASGRPAFPVVLFFHGMGASQFSYTSLIEHLVSYRYVVAAIEQSCSTDLTAFPDGRIVLREQQPAAPNSQPTLAQMMASALDGAAQGAADARFVLDRLSILNHGAPQSFPLAGRLDLSRVAVMGHSGGGTFAARACQLDARFRACIDLEGQLIPVEVFPDFSDGATFKQPILMMETDRSESEMGGTHAEHEQYFRKREAQLEACPRGSYYVSLREPGFIHASFSDGPILNAPDETARAQAEARLAVIERIVLEFLQQSFTPVAAPILTPNSMPATDAAIRPLGNLQ